MTGPNEAGQGVGGQVRLPPVEALCWRCNYPLRGLAAARCPECGREFDAADHRTMNLGRPVGWLEKAWLEPPGYWLNGLAGLLGVLTIVSASGPGGYLGFAMLVFIAWVVFGALWLLRLIGASGIAYARKQLRSPAERTVRRWFAAPLIAAMSILVALSSWPAWLALRLSMPAMDRLALQWAKDWKSLPRSGWIGVFPADSIEGLPGGVRFTVQGAGFLDCEGFAYFEAGVPPADGGVYKSIGGLWFRWTDPF